MLNNIKKNIEQELAEFIISLNKKYKLSKLSPLLYKSLIDFLNRPGKRIRPLLFILSYKGFSKKKPKGLYRSALALELLHCFLLIHDDILDNADIRRDKPSMHVLLSNYLSSSSEKQSIGMSLALITGDLIYALAIDSFMAINESFEKKQKALLKFIESGFYTGCGEFVEIVNSRKEIKQISKKEIYQTYDYKTAYYTFSAPIITAAILAGAKNSEIKKLFKFGKYCGRAFQIKDDILGIFAEINQTGKSNLSDIQENKKTLLVWYAYKHANHTEKTRLKNILGEKKLSNQDITDMRRILRDSGSLRYCLNLIKNLTRKSIKALKTSQLKKNYQREMICYCQEILKI
ncbi:MAG: polyprenyl synthetase family protein [Candidatus Omnitrophica bacterium]|nr:polyprenyl synthetase family protein [Candidatus Omnitrophota bacterium]